MDISAIVAVGALLLSCLMTYRQWRREKRQEAAAINKAPAERDAIIVASAQDVVAIQKLALTDCTDRLDDMTKRMRHAEREIAKLKNEGIPINDQ